MSNPVIPRPRESYHLEGEEGPERAFLGALARGRLHHAWLLVGPEGVGKELAALGLAARIRRSPRS